MTPPRKVKLRPGQKHPLPKVKLGPRSQVKPGPGDAGLKVKLPPDSVDQAAEDWKILKTFVGVKFNDAEKRRLWPAVAPDHVDLFGHRMQKRANLGTFIKQAIWEKIERDYPGGSSAAAKVKLPTSYRSRNKRI